MANYIPRVADKLLDSALQRAGAVLVEGPKGCGKTETSRQASNSEVQVDTDPNVAIAVNLDPALVLDGETPRLVDEWQIQPILWDVARRLIDERRSKGQFIFTGSTVPSESVARHSGAGRFARLTMRTMSMFESGEATGGVSLSGLVAGECFATTSDDRSIQDLFERMCRGGWPGNIGLTLEQARENNRDYLRTIAEVDINTPDGMRRDPMRVMAVLRTLARGVGTEMSVSTIASDADVNRETVSDYLDSLARIFVSEDQPAWTQKLRSRTPLRKAPKRHLTDPAVAMAAMGKGPDALLSDLNYAGQLFESFVVHELRVLTANPVYHARLQNQQEVDALVEIDGVVLLVEVKLGHTPEVVDQAAENLLKFSELIDGPTVPLVITGSGMSYQRNDGVHVTSIAALEP